MSESVKAEILRRMERLQQIGDDVELQRIELALCAADPAHWCNTWAWTYDPRASQDRDAPPYLPFVLFPKQVELIHWLEERVTKGEEAVVEKSRDVGWTWIAAAFALHRWLFFPGFKSTFGSRKEVYIDKLGDPDSIFGKIRLLLERLPPWMIPDGFSRSEHDNFCRLLNPMNGNIISGEAGDNMGRGGRSSAYFVDEGAFIERAEKVDAAIVANANCRIWASSVNGMGNLFARKRFSGVLPVFTYHWRDDPRKTEAWAEKTKRTTDPTTWAAEYDLDYSASVEGICIPAKWVEASRRIRGLTEIHPSRFVVAGLDVGGGRDKSVFVARRGPVVDAPQTWGDPDTIETAHRAIDHAKTALARHLLYDNVGVGIGVASAMSRHSGSPKPAGVNVGEAPTGKVWPDGRTSKEMFKNLKAELWWTMREAFKRTYEHVLWLEGAEGGRQHAEDSLLVLPDDQNLVTQISLPKWFRTDKGQIILESKDQLRQRGVGSPDYADALALTFMPVVEDEPAPSRTVKRSSMAGWT